jgi:acyl-CoA thioesterase-1
MPLRRIIRLALAGIVLIGVLEANIAQARTLTVVALGDSLTAGYLLPADKAFPAVLERVLKARGRDVSIVNGGVSGDTTNDGLARLDWSVPEGTDAVILELGANDMLRGLDPSIPRAALQEILSRLSARKIPVLIAGMKAQRNLGPRYVEAFDSIYPDLAREFTAPLYPFFMDGVADDTALLQKDGLHPTQAGVERIVDRMLPVIELFLDRRM